MLENIQEYTDSLSKKDWDKLFDFIPKIEASKDFGTVEGGEETKDGSFQLPYYNWSSLVHEFHRTMYDLDLVISFDWSKWTEGKEIMTKKDFKGRDMVTLLKLLSVILRAERFVDGYLIGRMEDGTVLAILKELKVAVNSE